MFTRYSLLEYWRIPILILACLIVGGVIVSVYAAKNDQARILSNAPAQTSTLPAYAIDRLVELDPTKRLFLIFDIAGCASSYRYMLNYLHRNPINEMLVLTSEMNKQYVRGVNRNSELQIITSEKELLELFLRHGNPIIVERVSSTESESSYHVFVDTDIRVFPAKIDSIFRDYVH